MMMDAAQILNVVPHRYPFLFIDRVVEVKKGESIVAEHLVSMCNPLLQGHFPGNPIVPGVVQIEAMAQAALVLSHVSGHFDHLIHNCYFLGIQDAKFRAPAVPGEVLRITVSASRMGRLGRFSGTVSCGDTIKSTANFIAVVEAKDKAAKARAKEVAEPGPGEGEKPSTPTDPDSSAKPSVDSP